MSGIAQRCQIPDSAPESSIRDRQAAYALPRQFPTLPATGPRASPRTGSIPQQAERANRGSANASLT
jgi:hypothetical protein